MAGKVYVRSVGCFFTFWVSLFKGINQMESKKKHWKKEESEGLRWTGIEMRKRTDMETDIIKEWAAMSSQWEQCRGKGLCQRKIIPEFAGPDLDLLLFLVLIGALLHTCSVGLEALAGLSSVSVTNVAPSYSCIWNLCCLISFCVSGNLSSAL